MSSSTEPNPTDQLIRGCQSGDAGLVLLARETLLAMVRASSPLQLSYLLRCVQKAAEVAQRKPTGDIGQ